MISAHEVAFIVANWTRWRDTIECLSLLYWTKYPDFVIVVTYADGGSKEEKISSDSQEKRIDRRISPGRQPSTVGYQTATALKR
jgi:GT2 family glycosyltransferase